MSHETAAPILSCPDIDEIVAFCEALGFERTYRQLHRHGARRRRAVPASAAGLRALHGRRPSRGSRG